MSFCDVAIVKQAARKMEFRRIVVVFLIEACYEASQIFNDLAGAVYLA